MKPTNPHLTEDQFIAYLCEEQNAADRQHVLLHINHCSHCAAEFATYQTIFSGLSFLLKSKQIRENLPTLVAREFKQRKIYYGLLQIQGVTSLAIAKSMRGVIKITLNANSLIEFEDSLHKQLPKHIITASAQEISEISQQLQEYFAGERQVFEIPIDWSLVKSEFQKKVLEALCKVPFGKTVSYGFLAHAVGKPGGSRAVGNALNQNPVPIVIPCHRVIASDRQIGGFGGGTVLKEKLLKLEGVRLSNPNAQLSLF